MKIEICFSNESYASVLMHSLRHPYDDVCGILLGTYSQSEKKGGDETKKEAEVLNCMVSRIVPLFHDHVLSPHIDLAFTLTEEYCEGSEEQIVGFYHISADDSKNVNIQSVLVRELIFNKLVTNYKNAVICLVQISKLKELNGNCLKAFAKAGSTDWKDVKTKVSEDNYDFFKKNISKLKYLSMCDFEDHLNCASNDFMNSNLFKET